jgi:hypothetical protein
VLEHADVAHRLAALEPHERLGHVLPHEAVRGGGGDALGRRGNASSSSANSDARARGST